MQWWRVAEAFLTLSRRDQADASGVAADRSGRPVKFLQKDVWVVWALETLFAPSPSSLSLPLLPSSPLLPPPPPPPPPHWYDIVALDRSGHASAALADRSLADRVGRHKNVFFREKDSAGSYIDYTAAVRGQLQLVPEGDRLATLADDYARMVDDRLLFETPPTFESVIERCQDIQQRANAESPVSTAT